MSQPVPMVYVVSDHAATCRSLDSLAPLGGWAVRTFRSATEFLAFPPAPVPSCILIEATTPAVDWLDVQARVATHRRYTPVIFLSPYIDLPMAVRAIKAGALEFFTNPWQDHALMVAIGEAVERSRIALDRAAEGQTLRDAYASLSRREREVMALVACGYLNKQVGSELGISEITVKAHRGKVMRKMRAGSFADLVRMAAGLQLPTPPVAARMAHH